VTSLAETFLLGHSASVTDAVMALAIALIFGLITQACRHGHGTEARCALPRGAGFPNIATAPRLMGEIRC
jgi:alcohol dehydrogenase class IV